MSYGLAPAQRGPQPWARLTLNQTAQTMCTNLPLNRKPQANRAQNEVKANPSHVKSEIRSPTFESISGKPLIESLCVLVAMPTVHLHRLKPEVNLPSRPAVLCMEACKVGWCRAQGRQHQKDCQGSQPRLHASSVPGNRQGRHCHQASDAGNTRHPSRF